MDTQLWVPFFNMIQFTLGVSFSLTHRRRADNIVCADHLQHQSQEDETRSSEEGGGKTGTRESERSRIQLAMIALLLQLSHIITHVCYIYTINRSAGLHDFHA